MKQGSIIGAFLTPAGMALRQWVSYLGGNHGNRSVDNLSIALSATVWNEIFGSDNSFNYGDSLLHSRASCVTRYMSIFAN